MENAEELETKAGILIADERREASTDEKLAAVNVILKELDGLTYGSQEAILNTVRELSKPPFDPLEVTASMMSALTEARQKLATYETTTDTEH